MRIGFGFMISMVIIFSMIGLLFLNQEAMMAKSRAAQLRPSIIEKSIPAVVRVCSDMVPLLQAKTLEEGTTVTLEWTQGPNGPELPILCIKK